MITYFPKTVSDTAYDATSWDTVTDIAPIKNAARDKIETLQPLDSDLTSWAAITRAAGFDTLTATPTSANLRGLLTDENGTGAALFDGATNVSFITPNLGTPSAVNLTNGTALPVSGITGSTSTALGVGSIELGDASDTTLSRLSAGVLAVEGLAVALRSDALSADGVAPTAPVGRITMAYKTGMDFKTSANKVHMFQVPASRIFVPTGAWAVVTAVTGSATGAVAWRIENSNGNLLLSGTSSSGTTAPVVGMYYVRDMDVVGSGPYTGVAAGDYVQVDVVTGSASTSLTCTVFVTGFYAS